MESLGPGQVSFVDRGTRLVKSRGPPRPVEICGSRLRRTTYTGGFYGPPTLLELLESKAPGYRMMLIFTYNPTQYSPSSRDHQVGGAPGVRGTGLQQPNPVQSKGSPWSPRHRVTATQPSTVQAPGTTQVGGVPGTGLQQAGGRSNMNDSLKVGFRVFFLTRVFFSFIL